MRRLTMLVLLFLITGSILSQTINRVEYYFDTDPGYGNATAVSISPGADVSSGFTLNTSGLTAGLHKLCIRAKSTANCWSETNGTLFYVPDRIIPTNIVRMEYYFDNDPGYGNAVQVTITPDINTDNTFALNISGLPEGIHKLSVRTLNIEGRWSETTSCVYYQPDLSGVKEIVNMEYYFDVDPGFGNGTPVSFTQGLTPSAVTGLNTSSLTSGIHKLSIRAKNSAEKWSETSTIIYFKQDPANQPISGMEYYFDFDPGYGNGTQVPVIPGDNISQSVSVNTTGLGPGGHIMYIRTKNNAGVWSETNNFTFSNFAIKIYLEGLYDPSTGKMNKAQNEYGDQWPAEVADHVSLEFRKHAAPHILDHTYELEMRQDGLCFALLEGDYTDHYLIVKHRNSISTWSADAINSNTTALYDFSSSVNMAFGSNMIGIGSIAAIFSGDIDRDGLIDSSDMAIVDNDAAYAVNGYLDADINGDGLVDASDFAFLDNNSAVAISVNAP